MPPMNMGSSTGIGDNFAKTRLLLAKRAGYLPENFNIMPGQGMASQQWRTASKNLAADARADGSANPIAWLRNKAQAPTQRPGVRGHIDPAGALAYANSRLATMHIANPAAIMPKPPVQPLLLLQMLQRGRMVPRNYTGMGM